MEYWQIKTGEESEPGIDGGMSKIDDAPGFETSVTIDVKSIDNVIKHIQEFGGEIIQSKMPIPGLAFAKTGPAVLISYAIAIHNIPEGISVSIPIFYATGNKNKAFIYSFLSGIAEPVGAVIGFLILLPFLSEGVLASLMAFIAGIMVYISLDELIPMAHRYGHAHMVIMGVVLGMFVMALSLLVL